MKAPNPLNNLIFMSFPFQSHVLLYHSYVIRTSLVCTRMSSVCHSYVTRMPSVCYSYVLLWHPYVTHMYSYVIRMSLECTRMSSVCHSYVLVCHPYVTRMWFYHEPFWTLWTQRKTIYIITKLHLHFMSINKFSSFDTAYLLIFISNLQKSFKGEN